MLDVERWAELRREHFVRGVPIKELARRYGIDRNTVRRALRSDRPPRYERPRRPSKLDPFKDEIHRLLRRNPKLTGVRVRELIEPLGFEGSKTIVDDYLARPVDGALIGPLVAEQRPHLAQVCQFDLWEPSEPVPVGHGQRRRGWVVVGCLGYSRAGAGALVFSKQAPDVLWGVGRCLWSLGALPELLVWDREGALHAGGGRPTEVYAAFCGQLAVDWHFCEPADPEAKGVVERLQGYLETNFEPGRLFANELDYQLQLDAWFEKANARTHKTLRARPVDRLAAERAAMRPLPERPPETDRRWVTRVAPDPYLRFETNDYSLDPRLVGRRVEVRVSQRQLAAVCLDTGELAARGAQLRPPTHDHRARARARPAPAPRRAGVRSGGRGATARALRRPDRVSTASELSHLFRALKAPAAARALPKLAERARSEEWSYERFAEALLSTEQSSREAHGGEARIRVARFPARKTLEEFDFTFQRSVKKQVIEHLGQLDFLHARENVVLLGPPDPGSHCPPQVADCANSPASLADT